MNSTSIALAAFLTAASSLPSLAEGTMTLTDGHADCIKSALQTNNVTSQMNFTPPNGNGLYGTDTNPVLDLFVANGKSNNGHSALYIYGSSDDVKFHATSGKNQEELKRLGQKVLKKCKVPARHINW